MPGPAATPQPVLVLPGFLPDAVPFALRLAAAMVLAYGVSFAIQLDSASSAGVCVGIVMQPSLGMTMSKAVYRIAGTLAGGVAALVIAGLFPQDRTLLLMAVALWLGACTYVASLLRDFRAYGAVLAGYTASVIAVGQIAVPQDAFLATLDRVAAILVGITCVGVVNCLFLVDSAHARLVRELERQEAELRVSAVDLLRGGPGPDREPHIERAAAILSLQTEASYASAELADGISRNHAATTGLSALLGMLVASRELRRGFRGRSAAAASTRMFLAAAADALAAGDPGPPVPPEAPPTPTDALLIDRTADLVAQAALARAAIDATRSAAAASLPPWRRLRPDPDHVAAILNASRAMAATGLGALLCVLGNDSSTTLLLIQVSAFTALLGLQPNPSAAAANFLPPVPVVVAFTGAVVFLLLPQASGFGPFALVVGAATFALGLVSRHPRTAAYGPAALIYFTILLSPSNPQGFNPVTFANLALQLLMSALLTIAAFRLLLPVQPRRRLLRVAGKVVGASRHALRHGCRRGRVAERSMALDRLAQALTWARARRPGAAVGSQPVLARLCAFTELEIAADRAWDGLRGLAAVPRTAAAVLAGQAALDRAEPDAAEAAAKQLLAASGPADRDRDPDRMGDAAWESVLQAVSGLQGTALLLRAQARGLRRYGVVDG